MNNYVKKNYGVWIYQGLINCPELSLLDYNLLSQLISYDKYKRVFKPEIEYLMNRYRCTKEELLASYKNLEELDLIEYKPGKTICHRQNINDYSNCLIYNSQELLQEKVQKIDYTDKEKECLKSFSKDDLEVYNLIRLKWEENGKKSFPFPYNEMFGVLKNRQEHTLADSVKKLVKGEVLTKFLSNGKNWYDMPLLKEECLDETKEKVERFVHESLFMQVPDEEQKDINFL